MTYKSLMVHLELKGDGQDRQNVVADGLKTSHADKGNRRGNKSVFLGAFPNEINSLGRRFVSHQPPHPEPLISSGFFFGASGRAQRSAMKCCMLTVSPGSR